MQYRNDQAHAVLVQSDPPQLVQPGEVIDHDDHVAGLAPLQDAGDFVSAVTALATDGGVTRADLVELRAGLEAAAVTDSSPRDDAEEASATAAAGPDDQGVTP